MTVLIPNPELRPLLEYGCFFESGVLFVRPSIQEPHYLGF